MQNNPSNVTILLGHGTIVRYDITLIFSGKVVTVYMPDYYEMLPMKYGYIQTRV